jgi:hypothetical protein
MLMQVSKPKVSYILSAACLAAGLAMLAPSDAVFAQQQPQHPPAAGTMQPGGGTVGTKPKSGAATAKEDHPKMEAALMALNKAKSDLQAANHDFHGHRLKALELVNIASEEIRAGLASDKD